MSATRNKSYFLNVSKNSTSAHPCALFAHNPANLFFKYCHFGASIILVTTLSALKFCRFSFCRLNIFITPRTYHKTYCALVHLFFTYVSKTSLCVHLPHMSQFFIYTIRYTYTFQFVIDVFTVPLGNWMIFFRVFLKL